jgi:carbonic anhydrase/acetyltransferase-like protein (isoleucine patch superfamily)
MLRSFFRDVPRLHATGYIHDSAEIIGRVTIKKNASIWPMVVLRGDIEPITIGEDSNVQDAVVMHTARGVPVVLGKGVTVGHSAVVHGAKVGDYCLIGMGAILLDGCVIGKECLIGAGALVPEGMKVPPRSLVVGVPGRVKRPITAKERRLLHERAKNYIRYAQEHSRGSRPL